MSTFRHDGLRFNYEEFGRGVPFIFSHGLGADLGVARDLIGKVPGYRTIIYDNRGHGLTVGNPDPASLTFAMMAGDMAAVLDHLRIESAIIGGESMGAGISLAFWKRFPQRVRAMILTRPAWLNVKSPQNLAVLGTVARFIDRFGREGAAAPLTESADFVQLKSVSPQTAEMLLHRLHGPSDLALVFRAVPASVPFERFEELQGIKVPTMILANPSDPFHPFECAQRLYEAIPGASLHEIPSKVENADQHTLAFRQRVVEFIANLPQH